MVRLLSGGAIPRKLWCLFFFAFFFMLFGCGGLDDSAHDAVKDPFEAECQENREFVYSTNHEAQADRQAKYLDVTAYSHTLGEAERHKAEGGAFAVNVSWSSEVLSTNDAGLNTATLEFFDDSGTAATSVVFKREENPLLLMMDMKTMGVSHSNHLCKMQRDATYTMVGNRLTIASVNFIMASDPSKGHLWFFHRLKATVNGKTDVVKRLDLVPRVMNSWMNGVAPGESK